MIKKMINNFFYSGFFAQIEQLTGFHLFNRCTTLFEENTVPTIRTPDINVDLNFLLAPCAFICTCHNLIQIYPLICSRVRSIARWAIFMAGVCGWYAPPANL